MKRKFISCVLTLSILCSVCSVFGLTANALVNKETYYSTTVLKGNDYNIRNDIQRIFNLMGYNDLQWQLPNAHDAYNDLQYNSISIFHGHGSAGFIAMYDSNLKWQSSMYAKRTNLEPQDTSMHNLPANNLTNNKMVIFISCHSAQSGDEGFGLPQMAQTKGAKFSLGFYDSVSRGGEWANLFVGNLHNRYTISKSMSLANDSFNKNYPSMIDDHTSPTYSGNLRWFGNSNQVIRIN